MAQSERTGSDALSYPENLRDLITAKLHQER